MTVCKIRERGAANDWPVLSISILSYNQKHLLSRAIDSVLDQRTDFPCEILVGDDCSDDGSQELLRGYQQRYPHLIYLILHPRRYTDEIPGRTNNMTNLLNCRGEFTAMLDGDDYYCDPDKLQRQVELLRENEKLSFSCHESSLKRADAITTHKGRTKYSQLQRLPIYEGIYKHDFIIAHTGTHFHISSIVFRTQWLRPFPKWFRDVLAADRAIFYLLSTKGDFHYGDWVGSVRYYDGNNFISSEYWSGRTGAWLKLRDIEIFGEAFPMTRNTEVIRKRIGGLNLQLAGEYAADGKTLKAAQHYLKAGRYLYRFATWRKLKARFYRSRIVEVAWPGGSNSESI